MDIATEVCWKRRVITCNRVFPISRREEESCCISMLKKLLRSNLFEIDSIAAQSRNKYNKYMN